MNQRPRARRTTTLAFTSALALLAIADFARAAPVDPTPLIGQGASTPVGNGLVSAADPRAAAAGVQILREGGTATDAAIAVMLALNVVEPQSSGIGGGGFLLTGDAAGHVDSFDGREEAPAAARPDRFSPGGHPLPFDQAQPGGDSVGVPGSLRLVWAAHQAHGQLPWAQLFAPAIALARDGFVLTTRLYGLLSMFPGTGALEPAGRALYYGADGKPLPVGTVIRNPALAATLTRIANQGPEAFYAGPLAQEIAAAVSQAPYHPAPFTVADLAAYRAIPRPAVCGQYRTYRVCSMGPPSSGAQVVLQTLGQLERFDLAKLGPDNPVSWHLIAESERLAYADREKYLGDPAFVKVPMAGLLDPAYLAQRSRLISDQTSLPTVSAGTPPGVTARYAPARPQVEHGTSDFAVVDKAGNAASYTSTIESIFGSGLIVGGFFLNNELTDFNFEPDRDGVPTANRLEPGKRPRSSMAPTLIYAADGRLRLVIGAAGGATIPAQVIRATIGMLDWQLSPKQALALPTIFAPGDVVFVEAGSKLEAMIPALTALGQQVKANRSYTKTNAIERVGETWVGAADPRSEGAALAQ